MLAVVALHTALLAGCGENAPPPAPEIPPEKQELIDMWEARTFVYADEECEYTEPGRVMPVPFQCGKVIMGLQVGLSLEDVRDLVEAMRGIVIRDATDLELPQVHLTVLLRTEKQAILIALRDPRTRWASVSRLGGIVP
jgi:hypothetical protein